MFRAIVAVVIGMGVWFMIYHPVASTTTSTITYQSCQQSLVQYFQHPYITDDPTREGTATVEYIWPANAEHGLFWCENYVGSKNYLKLVQ